MVSFSEVGKIHRGPFCAGQKLLNFGHVVHEILLSHSSEKSGGQLDMIWKGLG